MIRADLAAAGVPVEVDGPEGVETRDFHALRAVFISDVIRAGADLKQAMTLARHSDPRLTASRYARTRLHDLGAVVDKLPQPESPATSPEPAVLRMTGTDGTGHRDDSGAATGAAGSSSRRGRLRILEEMTDPDPVGVETSKPLEFQGFEKNRERLKTEEEEARAGIEPANDGFANRCLTAWRPGHHCSGIVWLQGVPVNRSPLMIGHPGPET